MPLAPTVAAVPALAPSLHRRPRAILFDLDGTLADTAPDLAAAVNRLRIDRGLPPVAYSLLRPVASAGARGLIGAAFGMTADHPHYETLRIAFLENYTRSIATQSTLFTGVIDLLDALAARGIAWGIVTNKAARLTDRLVPLIGLQHAGCVISGDTTAHAKPHPAPLLEAASRLGIPARQCWYVGDDLRDIDAGRAAGMVTVAAAWGYCGATQPQSWAADMLLAQPLDILSRLNHFDPAS